MTEVYDYIIVGGGPAGCAVTSCRAQRRADRVARGRPGARPAGLGCPAWHSPTRASEIGAQLRIRDRAPAGPERASRISASWGRPRRRQPRQRHGVWARSTAGPWRLGVRGAGPGTTSCRINGRRGKRARTGVPRVGKPLALAREELRCLFATAFRHHLALKSRLTTLVQAGDLMRQAVSPRWVRPNRRP
jgi:hypothetical protein